MFDAPVVCPAGEPIGEAPAGSGVRCRITHDSILAAENPSSIVQFCCSDGYRRCTTWLAEKARIEAARKKPLVEA